MNRFSRQEGCCKAPYSVNISVTEKCPLRCPFCFHEYDQCAELSLAQVCRYLDELAEMGTAQVQFSGGEPLVYRYLAEAIEYAHRKGLRTVISTSGVGLTAQYVQKLKTAGLDCVCVSLNGSTKEIHSLTRDGFEYAINALRLLSDTDIMIGLNWVANHENVADLRNVIELAKSNNVHYISVMPLKDSSSEIKIKTLNSEDFELLMGICSENKGFLVPDSCFEEFAAALKGERRKLKGCRAGSFYMAISARGEFLSCPHLTSSGMAFGSIRDYWQNDEGLKLHRKERNCVCLKTKGTNEKHED